MNYELLTTLEASNDIVREVEKRRRKLIDADDLMFFEEVAEYGTHMKEKYREICDRTRAYHALIGSGLPQGAATADDFPGEDSVLKFLSDLEKKILRAE